LYIYDVNNASSKLGLSQAGAKALYNHFLDSTTEFSVGKFTPASGVSEADGYLSKYGPFICWTTTLVISSATADSGIVTLGSLQAAAKPLRRVALNCIQVGGAIARQVVSPCYLETDSVVKMIPKFTDTDAPLLISGVWRYYS